MFVNKIGQHHLELGENCQDFGKYEIVPNSIHFKIHKLVCDGCSEGKHSEIGAKLFTKMNNAPYMADSIMKEMVDFLGDEPYIIKNYLCFTILDVWEFDYTDSEGGLFEINYCGDGYFITQDYQDNIEFTKIDNGEFPKYFSYNFINDKSKLSSYRDGVRFETEFFDKKQFKNVGVASDGIRYILNCENNNLREEFISILREDKEVKMKRFINKHQSIFKDDVTIAF